MDEMIFFAGRLLIAISVSFGLVSGIVLHFSSKKLKSEFEREYGPEYMISNDLSGPIKKKE